jgi:hypothetical protein
MIRTIQRRLEMEKLLSDRRTPIGQRRFLQDVGNESGRIENEMNRMDRGGDGSAWIEHENRMMPSGQAKRTLVMFAAITVEMKSPSHQGEEQEKKQKK